MVVIRLAVLPIVGATALISVAAAFRWQSPGGNDPSTAYARARA
jgi:hypothetical protein